MTTAGSAPASATWWRSLVAALLLACVLATVYVLALAVLGTSSDPLAVRWQNGTALALCIASAVPTWRWLHVRVHELADSYHRPQTAMTALSTPPGSSVGDAAGAVAKAVNLPWVEIVLDRVSSAGRRPDGVDVVEVPVRFDGEVFGAIRVPARRRVGALTSADLDVLRELAHQLALRVAAERSAERLAQSRAQIVAAQEEERVRIRRDLHDGLSPSLASIQLQLTALRRGVADDALRDTVDGLLDDVRQTSADLRRVVYDLRPPMLDDLGLRGALAHRFASVTAPEIRLEIGEPALPAAVEVALLRIATEATVNAVKHAHASTVTVSLEARSDEARLTVADDGVGVAGDVLPGVGLSSMRERAEELGGSLTVDSGPGTGTTVTAVIGWSS